MIKKFIVMILLIPMLSIAGVIITAKQDDEISKTYVQGKLMKVVIGDYEMIFDGYKEVLYSIDHERRVITIVTKEDVQKMSQFATAFGSGYGLNQNPATKVQTKVVKIGKKRIAGCKTVGFKFYESGELVSETYYCKDKKLLRELNPSLEEAFFKFSAVNDPSSFRYKEASKYGVPFYSRDYKYGKTLYEVTDVTYKKLSKSLFRYPSDYQITRLSDMFKQIPGMPPGMPGGVPGGMPFNPYGQ